MQANNQILDYPNGGKMSKASFSSPQSERISVTISCSSEFVLSRNLALRHSLTDDFELDSNAS